VIFPKYKASAGVTIVELLVSMVVGLIILSGVVKVVVDSKSTFLLEQEYAFIQENARFLMDELGYEVRMAGYFGCNGEGQLTNTLDVDPSDDDDWAFTANGIKGYEQDDGDLPDTFDSANVDTDILILSHGVQDDSVTVKSHNPASSTINLAASQPFAKGDVLVIADAGCENMAVFQMSGPNSSNPSTIVHNTGGSTSPGNCRKALSTSSGGAYSCVSGQPSASEKGREFGPGSAIMRYRTSGYYLANSDVTDEPTLYRASLVNGSGNASAQSQELLTGVEDMQVIFGVDNSDPSDGIIDRYYDSDGITVDEATSASGWVGWDRVLTAQMTFILRSSRPVFASNTEVDLGDGDTFNDRFIRQKVRSTTYLRNRGTE